MMEVFIVYSLVSENPGALSLLGPIREKPVHESNLKPESLPTMSDGKIIYATWAIPLLTPHYPALV
jgi:hypothetical protein